MNTLLPLSVGIIALASILMSTRARNEATFFHGRSAEGEQPGLLTLTFSQVTTWIFARSLMNAAILGFYYGLWGTLAYAAYYLSFLTGARIVDSLRFQQGFSSIQQFLKARFRHYGTSCYNFVIGVRLISEVVANLLVIGIIFAIVGTLGFYIAVMLFFQSMIGFYGSILLSLALLLVGPTASLITTPPNYATMICTGGISGMIVLLTLASQPGFEKILQDDNITDQAK